MNPYLSPEITQNLMNLGIPESEHNATGLYKRAYALDPGFHNKTFGQTNVPAPEEATQKTAQFLIEKLSG
jgi:hypothetical protein